VIIESIVTSIGSNGTVNWAPMGVEWGDDSIVLKPFIDTVTYPNVTESGSAVVNLTDDVRVFARSAIGNPDLGSFPAERIRGAVLADCCSWREVEVESVDNTPPRARVSTRIVHRGLRR
jgi:hypothetical protein